MIERQAYLILVISMGRSLQIKSLTQSFATGGVAIFADAIFHLHNIGGHLNVRWCNVVGVSRITDGVFKVVSGNLTFKDRHVTYFCAKALLSMKLLVTSTKQRLNFSATGRRSL